MICTAQHRFDDDQKLSGHFGEYCKKIFCEDHSCNIGAKGRLGQALFMGRHEFAP